MHSAQKPYRYNSRPEGRGFILLCVMIALPCIMELGLQLAGAGLIGSPNLRSVAYQNGAFWTGLLDGWIPNYPLQPFMMFVTYALLHAGTIHLAGNMIVLFILGRRVIFLFGANLFLLVYVCSAIGGGAGFALLSFTVQPMVGASGALFGLAGALLGHEYSLRKRLGTSRGPVIRKTAGLAILNMLFWFAEDGLLAWQAHLGGFVTGWLLIAFAENIRH